MEKFFKEYGVIILLYFVMVIGVLAYSSRMHTLRICMENYNTCQK